MWLFYAVFAFAFKGDLTKAMQTPIEGEVPSPAGVDLAPVGLDAPPKEPLFPRRAGPSAPGLAGGDGSIVLPFYLVSLSSLLYC